MRMRFIASALLIGAGLAGCTGNNTNRSLESVHQPVVRITSLTYDANASNGEMSPMEIARFRSWIDAMEVGYGDRIAIDESNGANSRAVRDAIATVIAEKGLLLSAQAPITAGDIVPGRVRIVVTRASAHVPGCPDWSSRSATNFGSATSSNYGCATNANMAAMVADPIDLVRGQRSGENDPLTASRAINAYRNAAPTGGGGTVTNGGGTGGGGQ